MDKQSPEMIEKDMERTRESLVEKVAALENQVVGTVQSATSTVHEAVSSVKEAVTNVKDAVTDTVESVKDSVQGTVDNVKDKVEESVGSVKDAFDVQSHVRNHPWACVGLATAAGVGLGLLFSGRRSTGGIESSSLNQAYHQGNGRAGTATPMAAAMSATTAAPSPPPSAPAKPGILDKLFDRFGDELTRIGSEAIRTLTQSIESNLTTGIPQMVDSAMAAGTSAVQQAVDAAATSAVNLVTPTVPPRGSPYDSPTGARHASTQETYYRG